MAFIESPRFPDTLAFGATGGPGFKTSVVATRSGEEQRNQHWKRSLGRWEVGLLTRPHADSVALLAFFNGVAKGRTHGFRFRDFLPGESTAVRSFLGLGTGGSKVYQLKKRYIVGMQAYDRPITKPVPGTVRLFANTIEVFDFTVDTATGRLTTTQALGATLTSSCTFDVPVRFDADHLRLERVDPGQYSWPSIVLVELRMPAIDDGSDAHALDAPVLSGVIDFDVNYVPSAVLMWTEPVSVEPILGYRLYRRAGNGITMPDTLLIDTPLRTYVDAETADGETVDGVNTGGYSYQVLAYTAEGDLPRSNIVWLYTVPDMAPALTATVTNDVDWDGVVTLTWTAGHFRGNIPIFRYALYADFAPDVPTSFIAFTTNLFYVPTGIIEADLRDPGFHWKVVAESDLATTLDSNVALAQHVTTPPTVPSFLTGMARDEAGINYVDLTWGSSSSAGPPVYGYVIYSAIDSPGFTFGTEYDASQHALEAPIVGFNSPNATDGHEFHFRVTARSVWGESDPRDIFVDGDDSGFDF